MRVMVYVSRALALLDAAAIDAHFGYPAEVDLPQYDGGRRPPRPLPRQGGVPGWTTAECAIVGTKRTGNAHALVLTDRSFALSGQVIEGRLLDFASAVDELPLELTDPAGGVSTQSRPVGGRF